MMSIGVRELRQHASRYLRRVRGGESIQVTDRGEPVALLVPMPDQGPIDQLEAEGRLSAASGDILDLGEPLAAKPGVPSPSEVLAAMRADEA